MNDSVVVFGQGLKMWQAELDNSNVLELNSKRREILYMGSKR